MATKRVLKVVRLLEPEMCLDCRFAHTAVVETSKGEQGRMVYCRRKDCDNWDTKSAEPGKIIETE